MGRARINTNGLVFSWARPLMKAKSAGRLNDQVRRHDVVFEVAVVRGEDVEREPNGGHLEDSRLPSGPQ
jgi:hypothetical protein